MTGIVPPHRLWAVSPAGPLRRLDWPSASLGQLHVLGRFHPWEYLDSINLEHSVSGMLRPHAAYGKWDGAICMRGGTLSQQRSRYLERQNGSAAVRDLGGRAAPACPPSPHG